MGGETMNNQDLCFLDQDDVLAGFVFDALRIHGELGRSDPYILPASKGIWEIENLMGITKKEFWEPLNSERFWDELPKTPEGDGIVKLATDVFGEENVAILTAPNDSPFCVPGKHKWMIKNYPQFKDRMIYTKAKHFLAGQGRVLIDDKDLNVESFRDAGGVGILVPRAWNSAHSQSDHVMRSIRYQLLREGYYGANYDKTDGGERTWHRDCQLGAGRDGTEGTGGQGIRSGKSLSVATIPLKDRATNGL